MGPEFALADEAGNSVAVVIVLIGIIGIGRGESAEIECHRCNVAKS